MSNEMSNENVHLEMSNEMSNENVHLEMSNEISSDALQYVLICHTLNVFLFQFASFGTSPVDRWFNHMF